MMQRVLLAWMLGVSLILGGCFGSGSSSGGSKQIDGAKALRGNTAPKIYGTPASSVTQNAPYDFKPSASDPNGDALTFAIAGKPAWAAFDKSSGRLSGKPGPGQVGTYANIRISVTDGRASASLPAFSIAVTQSADGSVTLSWMPPTENDDGSALVDLAGYHIYVGPSPAETSRVIVLSNAGLTRYVVEGLAPATWHFAMTSVNARGAESRRSATVSKIVG